MPDGNQQQQSQSRDEQRQGRQWQDLLGLGNKGINTFQSPLKIGPTFLADGENIEVEDGNISNRAGSIAAFDDPNNEPDVFITQVITAKDSHGVEYLTRYWGGNFEIWDAPNEAWVTLNQTAVTFSASMFNSKFGFANWNNGYGFAWNEGADVLYLGNGTDQLAKWVIARCVTTQDIHHGDVTVNVDQTVQFPPLTDAWHAALTSQPLLIAETETTYTATTSTTFTIPPWGGATVPSGATIYIPLQFVFDVSGGSPAPVKSGNMFVTVDQRLYSAGISGMETFLQFSGIIISGSGIPQPDPEYYTGTSGGINSGGLQEFADGDGPITALFDSLDNVIVMKKNSIRKFYFQQDTTLNAVLPVIAPVFTGPSSGSINNFATISVNQIAYYPTSTEGISTLTPSFTTAGTVTYQPAIISIPIQDIATDGVTWNLSEATYFDNKIIWSVSEEGSSIPDLILYYDIIAQAFGKERGWYANSWAIFENNLYFADRGSFGIKQAFSTNFDDGGQPYTSYALSSQFSFGQVGKLKQNDKIFIQGTINKGGNLYVDVYYNTTNGVWKETYQINGDNPLISFGSDRLFGTNPFGEIPFTGVSTGANLGQFKFYLTNNIQWMWNVIQIKLYSVDVGTQWEVQAVSMAPVAVEALNSDLDLYPGVATTVVQNEYGGFDVESFDEGGFS